MMNKQRTCGIMSHVQKTIYRNHTVGRADVRRNSTSTGTQSPGRSALHTSHQLSTVTGGAA